MYVAVKRDFKKVATDMGGVNLWESYDSDSWRFDLIQDQFSIQNGFLISGGK